jgi:hypothetical protein
MKLDNSNKRISKIIAGILVVLAVSIFIAIALGVDGSHLYIQEKMDPLYSGSHINLVDNPSEILPSGDLGNNKFVPIAQICPGGQWEIPLKVI